MKYAKYEYYLNRELSWLKFNERVLAESMDKNSPLMERLKFIAITSSNLDEFFMIRVGTLKTQNEETQEILDDAGLSTAVQLSAIADAAHKLVKLQYQSLSRILEHLEKHNVSFIGAEELSSKEQIWLKDYFQTVIFPVLTPLAVDASHPFPFLANRSLNLGITLTGSDKKISISVVQVPTVLPRLVETPSNGKKRRFLFLEDIIEQYAHQLFYGYKIRDVVPFRITRNADFLIDEEETEDLLEEVERSIRQRKRGRAVRLEIGRKGNSELKKFLIDELMIGENDLYQIQGPLDLTYLFKFADYTGFESLRLSTISPHPPKDLGGVEDLFAAIRERDILLHHPYESFNPVVDFVQSAAIDPNVLAIKQTLYRVSGNSPIVQALAQAAENGKQVTVVVEILARFDEENNILWARRLEEAGCHVIYGLVGLKTHAKMCLIVRREGGGIKRYVHMSTGNYNDSTAKIYTDIGLFTANDQFGADASGFFNVLTGYSDPPVWNKIVVAPVGLRQRLYELIDQEISCARQGKPAHIIAKMNALLDKDIVAKLYEASSAGVDIDLIVRGICVLRPGMPGVSDRIKVRSIVGRFLEHSRIFYFANGGDAKCYLSSADWMPRNLIRRVELFFPVENDEHIERLKDILDMMLADNQKSHIMKNDGTYRHQKTTNPAFSVQDELYRRSNESVTRPDLKIPRILPVTKHSGEL